ncbi:MAG: branched-chain amino acid ABC transporter permease [Bacillota bacterium]
MGSLVQIAVNGLAQGSIYALMALAIVVIYNTTETFNFAQGEFVLLAAYVSASLMGIMPWYLAMLVAVAVIALFGATVFQRVAYWPLRNSTFEFVIVSTLGVSLFLRNMAKIVWGAIARPYPEYFGGVWRVAGVSIVKQHVLILAMTGGLILLFYLFMMKTTVGAMMRATAQNKQAATLMGVKVSRMVALTYFFAALLGSVAGILVAPIFFLTIDMGMATMTKGFAATIVGGFGSIPGAIVGGLLLGLVEAFATAFISPVYKDAYTFVTLLAILVFLPRGIFGERIAEKV